MAGFFGSIPNIVSDDGDHQYTIDKAKAYAEYPDTRAIALQDRFGGWIRDDVKMVNDTNADQVTASDLGVREARNRVDGIKDVVPVYVRPDTEDSNTLQDNNTAISNYANNQISKWVQKGGIDKEWDSSHRCYPLCNWWRCHAVREYGYAEGLEWNLYRCYGEYHCRRSGLDF